MNKTRITKYTNSILCTHLEHQTFLSYTSDTIRQKIPFSSRAYEIKYKHNSALISVLMRIDAILRRKNILKNNYNFKKITKFKYNKNS